MSDFKFPTQWTTLTSDHDAKTVGRAENPTAAQELRKVLRFVILQRTIVLCNLNVMERNEFRYTIS